MPVAGPFYFKWTTASDTTFGVGHHAMDEYIFSARRVLAEGQKPVLELVVKNPRRQFIDNTGLVYAWFAYDTGTTSGVVPLFFGRLIAVPVDMFAEVITLQFVAEPLHYKQKAQQAVEPLKQLPWWDRVFISVTDADDPEKILETRASFLDVNPTTHAVTVVSIVEGPDGDVAVENHIYDSLQVTLNAPPATVILMDATVEWDQTASGIIALPPHDIGTTKADGIIGGWPRPLQTLGGGYSVEASVAYDSLHADKAHTVTSSVSWTNANKVHNNGDAMSLSLSSTGIVGGIIAGVKSYTYRQQTGVVDPFAVDGDGDPSPLNIPMSFNDNGEYILFSNVKTELTLRYDAVRPRSERVKFYLRADMQPILTEPEVSQNSETFVLSGNRVDRPIVTLLNWSSVAGQHVDEGTFIFPDDPNLPGSQTIQYATNSGTTGTDQPNFSDVAGDDTVDNEVTWSSLGTATPLDNARDWAALSFMVQGTIILPQPPKIITWDNLTRNDYMNGRTSANVTAGTVVLSPNGTYHQARVGGSTPIGTSYPTSSVVGTVVVIGNVEWIALGTSVPSGANFYVASNEGITGEQVPPFNPTLHSTTTDGTVQWKNIGSGEIPVGGVPGEIHAASYFDSDRGRLSLEYLALYARARLLYRARCVDVSFDVTYEEGLEFTTRKTVTITDPRLPGGEAHGKVKLVDLTVSGGVASCRVTISCLLGKGGSPSVSDGTAEYVDASYVEYGYQTLSGEVVMVGATSDMGYTPPVHVSVDDGLRFPLTREQIVVIDIVHPAGDGSDHNTGNVSTFDPQSFDPQSFGASLAANQSVGGPPVGLGPLSLVDQGGPWVEYEFKPASNGPFHKLYLVKFTELKIAKWLDLGTP